MEHIAAATAGIAGTQTETVGLPTRRQPLSEPAPLIPDYRFVKVIGCGAFGTVWLAEETMAGVFRAIKVLRPARARPAKPTDESNEVISSLGEIAPPGEVRREPGEPDPWASPAKERERLPSLVDRELEGIHAYQALAKDHPHLVRILKTGLCKFASETTSASATTPAPQGPPPSSFILQPSSFHTAVSYVMEIADHAAGAQPHHEMDYEPLSLTTLLRRQGRLPCGRVIEYAADLLDAVEHLHKAGLHHRDVKSGNVLFVNGVIKLADLGLTASDEAGETVGTPGYLPPPPAGSAPDKRFGPPDDLYALGKVMYEMLTGLPAASFPEWPADLDPASDPLLPRLRGLVNDLCHPAAERRLSDIRKTRQKLADIQAGPRMLRITHRRAWTAVAALAIVAVCVGVGAIVSWQRLTDPYKSLLGDSASDGSGSTQEYVSGGFRYSLSREHRPWERKCAGPADRTSVCFWDLQTKLGPAVDDDINVHPEKMSDCLIVAGAYQIQDGVNPVTGDVRNPRGKFDQLFLVVGEGPNMCMHLLYHGQPGRPPGTRGRFVWRLSLRKLQFREGEVWPVRLVCMEALTPAQAEVDCKKGADANRYSAKGDTPFSAIPLGRIAFATLAVAPTALSASQSDQ